MTPERLFAGIGALSALSAVAAGAFGAHALRERLGGDSLATFETAARYQMYHALALFVVAWAAGRWTGTGAGAGAGAVPQTLWAGWLFVVGTVLFSGSLYTLALTGVRAWGAVTPFGGVAWLAGWALLAWAAFAGR